MRLNRHQSDHASDVATEQRVQTFTSDRAKTQLRAAQRIVERKWHPLIVFHLLDSGPLSFSTLKDRMDSISNKMLSEALKDLTDQEIVNREVVNEVPVRVKYSLSRRGEALQPVIESMISWGSDDQMSQQGSSEPGWRRSGPDQSLAAPDE